MSKPLAPAWGPLAMVALFGVTACTSPPPAPPSAPPPPTAGFTATLVSPTDIVLRWPDDDSGVAGRMVEYATAPEGPFTTLQFLPARQSSYTHPDLIPETPFYYRLRPFSGPVTDPIEVGASPGGSGGDPAAPGDPLAVIIDSNDNVRFTWTDRAQGESGYLLEVRKPGSAEFVPVEVADPDSTSSVLAELPDEHGAAYRIRAFFYGPQSPVVHQTTGKD
ncbi:fibronectin type III domain-containing protein [Amycolatopsis sp. H20-H5]|uniref:fibronectin type III domain-containing protein n=1 Tax=Amycolatopsis sp. H20-H5 TaxID=3046309 RepID=UPI002DB8F960|nr:fibronectin type III domain-containing protein [Amycolatopsis sp. H20-H5]MEC3974084.1 fibronectin type III domain-containing protein [Amycolatopsis sp. H20-H5]